MSQKNTFLLRAILPLPFRQGSGLPQTVAERKYALQVERALALFATVTEWADYILFLHRLQKALSGAAGQWIPHLLQVLRALAGCLGLLLPSGVHAKALETYLQVFSILGPQCLNQAVLVWVPGVLPLMAYALIAIKPQLISVYQQLLVMLTPELLRHVMRPLVLLLLPGLDDELSELYLQVLDLVDSFKAKLDNNAHFWLCLFLCVVSLPDKRLGALSWCNKRMPSFNYVVEGDSPTVEQAVDVLSQEARACVTPDVGLLVRAFCKGLHDENVLVQRGFFDLLVHKMELRLSCVQVLCSAQDQLRLVVGACATVHRKDMSLNRRLWLWLLGPEQDAAAAAQHDDVPPPPRQEYFLRYGSTPLISGLLALIAGTSDASSPMHTQQIHAARMTLALMDKWEIGHPLVALVFVPLVRACALVLDPQLPHHQHAPEVVAACLLLFDLIELHVIWGAVFPMVTLSPDIALVEYILSHFNVEDEEMVVCHMPLVAFAALVEVFRAPDGVLSAARIDVALQLLRHVPSRAYVPPAHSKAAGWDAVYGEIALAYSSTTVFTSPTLAADNAALLLDVATRLVTTLLAGDELLAPHIGSLSAILTLLLERVPLEDGSWDGRGVVEVVERLPPAVSVPCAFATAALFPHLVRHVCGGSALSATTTRLHLLQIAVQRLWAVLFAHDGSHRVEVVRTLWGFERSIPTPYLEAAVVSLMLKEPALLRVHAFGELWTHTADIGAADELLGRPTLLVVEQCGAGNSDAGRWVANAVASGAAQRLFRLVVCPLLSQPCFAEHPTATDWSRLAYNLKQVEWLVDAAPLVVQAMASELVLVTQHVLERLATVLRHLWELALYLRLVVDVCLGVLAVEVVPSNQHQVEAFTACLSLLDRLVPQEDRMALALAVLMALVLNDARCVYRGLMTMRRLLTKAPRLALELFARGDELQLPMLRFIVQGLRGAGTPGDLEAWAQFAVACVPLFGTDRAHATFSLANACCHQILALFTRLQTHSDATGDPGEEIVVLMGCVELVLRLVHTPAPVSASPAAEPGFFGSVLQGVLGQEDAAPGAEGESPSRLNVLLAFHEAVQCCFGVWAWAERRAKTTLDGSGSGNKTAAHVANRLRFRSRKLLEALWGMEPLETLEAVLAYGESPKLVIRLVMALDGGLQLHTMGLLARSMTLRVGDELQPALRLLTSDLTPLAICQFMGDYVAAGDSDAAEEGWQPAAAMLRDVVAAPGSYVAVLPQLMVLVLRFAVQLHRSKYLEQKKVRRDMGDVFSKLLAAAVKGEMEPVVAALEETVPQLPLIVFEADRVGTVVSSVVTLVVVPLLKLELAARALRLLEVCGSTAQTRAWKTLVLELFGDALFFGDVATGRLWAPVVLQWLELDRDERMLELVLHVHPQLLTTLTLFSWSDGEVALRVTYMRRVAYLLAVLPRNWYLVSLAEVVARMAEVVELPTLHELQFHAYVCLRAVVLQYDEAHLAPYWMRISGALQLLFLQAGETAVPPDVLLGGCKLLDLLLVLGGEEFQLVQWLFVTDNQDAIYHDGKAGGQGLVEQLGQPDTKREEEEEEGVDVVVDVTGRSEGMRVPLLVGVQHIARARNLTNFFSGVSMGYYEGVYGGNRVDTAVCIGDVEADVYA